jgi:hypothetical protein
VLTNFVSTFGVEMLFGITAKYPFCRNVLTRFQFEEEVTAGTNAVEALMAGASAVEALHEVWKSVALRAWAASGAANEAGALFAARAMSVTANAAETRVANDIVPR